MPAALIDDLVIEQLIGSGRSAPDTYEIVVSVRTSPSGQTAGTGQIWSVGSWNYNVEEAIEGAGGLYSGDILAENAEAEMLKPVKNVAGKFSSAPYATNRGIWMILLQLGVNTTKLLPKVSTFEENNTGVDSGIKAEGEIAKKDFVSFIQSKGGEVTTSSMWMTPRPADTDPFRYVISLKISKQDLDDLNRSFKPAIELINPETPYDYNTRALPKFRQTFNNTVEFTDLIHKTAAGLKKYHSKLQDSYFKYSKPPPGSDQVFYSSEEVDQWPELSLKQEAQFLGEAGDKIVEFLRASNHPSDAPFEIGFQEYLARDEDGELTSNVRDDVKQGFAPGIVYVGRPDRRTGPVGQDEEMALDEVSQGGIISYTPYAAKVNPVENVGVKIDYGLNKSLGYVMAVQFPDTETINNNPNAWGHPDNEDHIMPFNEEPFTYSSVRWYLAKLKEIGYTVVGGQPTTEEKRMQAEAAAAVAAKEAFANPCAAAPPAIKAKEPMPVDDFVDKYVYPSPEKSFKSSSILDLANKLAGWHSGDDSGKNKKLERQLTTDDVLAFLVNESSTKLSDYVGDMVFRNLPAKPKKIRSVHDAYAYILRSIDLPTLITRLLECMGLAVSLEDLIDWLCEELIMAVDEKTDGGITSLIDFMENGDFGVPGEYLDIDMSDVMFEVGKLAQNKMDTGNASIDRAAVAGLQREYKRLLCFIIAVGPFAALAALIWLIMRLLEETPAGLDEVPARKKCDIEFSWPDDWPFLDSIWDFIVRKAKEKLEEEAMKWLEEEIIQPLRQLIWSILEFCEEDGGEYGKITIDDTVGIHEHARMAFKGRDASNFLKRLLAALTPKELCMLLNGDIPFENQKLQKILKFIMGFAADPANEAPLYAVVAENGGPGPFGSGENILAFFKSLSKRIDMSICDVEELPEESISNLCDDVGRDYEEKLKNDLQRQGLDPEEIEKQIKAKRDSKKAILGSAVQHMLASGNLTEKVQKDTKDAVQNIIIETLEGTNSAAIDAFINGASGQLKSDINNFSIAFADTTFMKRIIVGIELVKKERLFNWVKGSGTSGYHSFKFNLFDGRYLQEKAIAAEGTGDPETDKCEEIQRHIKLMEDLRNYMVEDLYNGKDLYWDNNVLWDLQNKGKYFPDYERDYEKAVKEREKEFGKGKSHSAYWIYENLAEADYEKKAVIEASWLCYPHKRLIDRYNNLTPQEFDDLAVIAFRYYSRHLHDYDYMEKPDPPPEGWVGGEGALRLKPGAKHYGTFHYSPLTHEGGVSSWGALLFPYDFHSKFDGAFPWDNNDSPVNPATSKQNIFDTIKKLQSTLLRNEGSYKIYTTRPEAEFHSPVSFTSDADYYTHSGQHVFLKRFGNWVPEDAYFSMSDMKKVLVQLLLFQWDMGADSLTDKPRYFWPDEMLMKSEGYDNDTAEKNWFGGHMLKALRYYKGGLRKIYGYETTTASDDAVGPEVHLVEAEWKPEADPDTTPGFYGGGWVPKRPYQDPNTLEIIWPDLITVSEEKWKAGRHGNSLLSATAVEAGEDQLIMFNPKTGVRARYIPAPKPTPWRLFCAVDKVKIQKPSPKPVYEAIYTVRSPITQANGELLDEISGCITDDYSMQITDLRKGGKDLLNYRSKEILKLYNAAEDKYTLDETKDVLGNWNTGPGWAGFNTLEPIAPQLFEKMILKQVDDRLPKFDKSLLQPYGWGQGYLQPEAGLLKNLNYSLHDVLTNNKHGRKNLYGTAFRELIRDFADLTLKHGIAMNLLLKEPKGERNEYNTIQEKIIASVMTTLSDISGNSSIVDLSDISRSASNKHKELMKNSDITDITTQPTIGKTLSTYPPVPPDIPTNDPAQSIKSEIDWSKGPGMIRVLVRIALMERIFRSLLTSSAFNTERVFTSGPLTRLTSRILSDSISQELVDKIKIVASDMGILGDKPNIEQAIIPIVEFEAEEISKKINEALGSSIPFLLDYLRVHVYDLAHTHPESNLYIPITDVASYFPTKAAAAHATIGAEKTAQAEDDLKDFGLYSSKLLEPKLALNEIVELQDGAKWASDAKFALTNNMHSTTRFFNEVGKQTDSGFILEKYIKIQFKENMKNAIENTSQALEFFNAWLKLPIEHRGQSKKTGKRDGEKYPAYLNPDEFRSAIGNFFTYFGNVNPDRDTASAFDWGQLFDAVQFKDKLQELSDKVYDNERKQGPGDKYGFDQGVKEDRVERDTWSNNVAEFTKGNYPASVEERKKMVISRSAEIQRHIALMERLLEYPLKQNHKEPEYEGYVYPGVKGPTAKEGKDKGRPFNIPAGMSVMPSRTRCDKSISTGGTKAGFAPGTVAHPSHIARWDNLSAQDKYDLETIAFRFYSRNYFGDLRAFHFDPHDSTYPAQARASGGYSDFVKRKGLFDSTVDFRTGLRRPGIMWLNAINQCETEDKGWWSEILTAAGGLATNIAYIGAGPIIGAAVGGSAATAGFFLGKYMDEDTECVKGLYPVPQPNDATVCLHIPTSLVDLIKMIQMQMYVMDKKLDTDNKAYHMKYNTIFIQEGVKTKQPSLEIPQLVPRGSQAKDGLRYEDPSESEIMEAMAKLLLYPYEIGNFTSNRWDDDIFTESETEAQYLDYTIPKSQRWTLAGQDVNLSKGGLHTDSKIGEKWTAVFGGHLWWALQYYKKGLWETGMDFVDVETGNTAPAPSPLNIFTTDFSNESTLIKIPGSTPPKLESLKDKPLTGPNGLADVHYGLRLSWLAPPDKISSSWRDYPLSPTKEGRQKRDSFWGAVKETLYPAITTNAVFTTQAFQTQADLKVNTVRTYDAMKRDKTFWIKEVPEAVPSVQVPQVHDEFQTGGVAGVGNEVFLFPILEVEDKVGDNKKWNQIVYNEEKFEMLFDRLKGHSDFGLLFDYVFPLQRIVSILASREMINFEQSQELLPYKDNLFSASSKHALDMLKFAFESSKDPRVGTLVDQILVGVDATEEEKEFLNELDKWIKEHT